MTLEQQVYALPFNQDLWSFSQETQVDAAGMLAHSQLAPGATRHLDAEL